MARNHTTTQPRTWRLYDQLGPEGPSWWKYWWTWIVCIILDPCTRPSMEIHSFAHFWTVFQNANMRPCSRQIRARTGSYMFCLLQAKPQYPKVFCLFGLIIAQHTTFPTLNSTNYQGIITAPFPGDSTGLLVQHNLVSQLSTTQPTLAGSMRLLTLSLCLIVGVLSTNFKRVKVLGEDFYVDKTVKAEPSHPDLHCR